MLHRKVSLKKNPPMSKEILQKKKKGSPTQQSGKQNPPKVLTEPEF